MSKDNVEYIGFRLTVEMQDQPISLTLEIPFQLGHSILNFSEKIRQ